MKEDGVRQKGRRQKTDKVKEKDQSDCETEGCWFWTLLLVLKCGGGEGRRE